MPLAIFDLDNTLLSCDSDFEWGQFLVKKNLVDAKAYDKANRYFYEAYQQGTLDIAEFSAFSFKPLSMQSMETLKQLHDEYMQTVIKPHITKQSRALIQQHKERGDTLMIITATNSFITRPIATELGINHLLATEPKIINGKYTTQIEGIPCFKEGKVKRLELWLAENSENLKESIFYSDSHNDLSLLEKVDTAVAVDPDDTLRDIALERNWEIISLR
jgi:HAD superfamily hydrolase (TIGR01490 family)